MESESFLPLSLRPSSHPSDATYNPTPNANATQYSYKILIRMDDSLPTVPFVTSSEEPSSANRSSYRKYPNLFRVRTCFASLSLRCILDWFDFGFIACFGFIVKHWVVGSSCAPTNEQVKEGRAKSVKVRMGLMRVLGDRMDQTDRYRSTRSC